MTPIARSNSVVPLARSQSVALAAADKQRFECLWTARSRFQKSALAAIGISMGGLWLASSSMDSNLLFIDLKTGKSIGLVNFESRFHITSILWDSDVSLYVGTSNGQLLYTRFNPDSAPHVVMESVLLDTFNAPVSTLALDPLQTALAVGCEGETAVFERPSPSASVAWRLLDRIPAPTSGPLGHVTSLGFVGSISSDDRRLFVGYAKAGFTMWNAPRKVRRTPYNATTNVCTIGSAALSSDGRFIAIATLEHSLVIYPMSSQGPDLRRRQIIQNKDQSPLFRPIVPIALAADNLVFRGSTTGLVSVTDLSSGPLAPIENTPQEVIRVLTTYQDKVVVGLSNIGSKSSRIKCYLDRTSLLSAYDDTSAFVDDDEDEGQLLKFEIQYSKLDVNKTTFKAEIMKLVRFCRPPLAHVWNRTLRIVLTPWVWVVLSCVWLFLLVLVVDPPEIPGFSYIPNRPQAATGVSHGYNNGLFSFYERQGGPQTKERYPGLASLVLFCAGYTGYRFLLWGAWTLTCCSVVIGVSMKCSIYLILLVPRAIRFAMAVIPDFLVVTICDAVQDIPVCPHSS